MVKIGNACNRSQIEKKNIRNGMDFSSNRFVAKIFRIQLWFSFGNPTTSIKKMCNSIWRMNVRRSLNNICSHYVTLSHCAILWNLLTISKPTCRYNDCNLVHWTDYNWTRVSQIKEIWTDGVEKHEADDYIYFVVYVMIKLFSDYTLMSFRITYITAPDICFHVSCFQNIRPS